MHVIVGVGNDLVEIERIDQACRRQGVRFLRRVLSDREFAVAVELTGSRQAEFVAGRFAVKEAMAKASGVGLGSLGMRHVDVQVGPRGLRVTVDRPSSNVPTGRWHVSISHSATLASAIAILEED